MDPSKFREGECVIVSTAIIDMPPIMPDREGNLRINPLTYSRLVLKAFVNSYDEARFHFLAVAERMRNYAAYVFQSRLPLACDMVGKRLDNGQWFPFPALFDGNTHLPITDGGVRDTMIFTTRFGSHRGVKPPDEALRSPEDLTKWVIQLNQKLLRVQQLLDKIESGTPLDIAVCAFGGSIWAEEAKDKVSDCWRAIEAITKADFPNRHITPPMLYKTIYRRTNAHIEQTKLTHLRLMRNIAIHSKTHEKQSMDMHVASQEMYCLSYQVIKSALKNAGFKSS